MMMKHFYKRERRSAMILLWPFDPLVARAKEFIASFEDAINLISSNIMFNLNTRLL